MMSGRQAGGEIGPPRFLQWEVVWVVAVTGDETYDLSGDPLDASVLLGAGVVVGGVRAAEDGEGWLIGVWIGSQDPDGDREMGWFDQDSLKSTGLIETYVETGHETEDRVGMAAAWVPLDRSQEEGWRDQITVALELETTSWAELEAVRGVVEAELRERCPGAELETWVGFGEHDDGELTSETIWPATDAADLDEPDLAEDGWDSLSVDIYPAAQAVEAFARVVAAPTEGWRYEDEDENEEDLTLIWEQPDPSVHYLAAGISYATATLSYYSSPKRPQLPTDPS